MRELLESGIDLHYMSNTSPPTIMVSRKMITKPFYLQDDKMIVFSTIGSFSTLCHDSAEEGINADISCLILGGCAFLTSCDTKNPLNRIVQKETNG